MHPDFLVLLLRELVALLLSVPRGRVVFERVGAMNLLLDGRHVCEWDLSKYLENMRPSGYEHELWKGRAIAHRKEFLTK
ncbi:hypothetical protein BJY00DRAFT_293531 [Aspergillus carlsbadensis]|nr:hypothetical protein BJY00DRAFT_293531 [Aspergillus carlsbadensis]